MDDHVEKSPLIQEAFPNCQQQLDLGEALLGSTSGSAERPLSLSPLK